MFSKLTHISNLLFAAKRSSSYIFVLFRSCETAYIVKENMHGFEPRDFSVNQSATLFVFRVCSFQQNMLATHNDILCAIVIQRFDLRVDTFLAQVVANSMCRSTRILSKTKTPSDNKNKNQASYLDPGSFI